MSAVTEPRAVRRPPAAPAAPAPVGEVRARQPKAIHSALTVLEEVARLGAGVTAQEISQSLGLPRATTYRLINLLVQDEYLVRMPDLTGFALGRKVVELAHLVAPSPPPQAVREVIAGLRSRIRGGIHLVRYEGDRVVITFHRTIPFKTTITLSNGQSVFDPATDVLSSSTIYTLPDGSDPLRMYGSFVRRIADFPSADDVRGRLK